MWKRRNERVKDRMTNEQLLQAISEFALALSEMVEPMITEDQLAASELDELILLKRRLDDAADIVTILSGTVKTEAEARVKQLPGQLYEIPSMNPGKIWRAKMKTRAGSVKLDPQGTKSDLVANGFPVDVITRIIEENTTRGKDSHYLEIREVKADSRD